jgi:hypothetical protein
VEDVVWHERKVLKHDFIVQWAAGEHDISFEVEPLPPVETAATAAVAATVIPVPPTPREPVPAPAAEVAAGTPPVAGTPPARGGREGFVRRPPATNVTVRIASVQVRGPIDPKFWSAPENYARFFPKGPAPEDAAGRDRYARDVLRDFATKAFRRPVEDAKVDQLVAIAKKMYSEPGKTFEEGVARAMMAVLGSSRFIFRLENFEPLKVGEKFAAVDEFALASRLSYFLWSTMPDEELFALARRGELRKSLRPQVARMLKDAKAQALVRNFTGQWLQARDVEFVPINARLALGTNAPRSREGRVEFDGPFRKLMRNETEMYFDYIIREDRSILELVNSDYTFLNEKLATHYGVPDVTGDQMRLVKLPPDSPRGGVLTQGTVLAVTSNPTRTSPVKRGLFILENILGTPPPPAPPNVPDLEEAKKDFQDKEPKLSDLLAVHRASPLCSSCHSRMDPLGLAMENFNALGGWRTTDAGQPIEPAGKLITGETFADIRELKQVLVRDRKMDIFRCVTEKLMTYALGRGLDYRDTHTIDEISERLAADDGRMSTLLHGIIESPAFQKTRTSSAQTVSLTTSP